MIFLVVVTILSAAVTLSHMAARRPGSANLERISGALLIAALALLGAALPNAHHW